MKHRMNNIGRSFLSGILLILIASLSVYKGLSFKPTELSDHTYEVQPASILTEVVLSTKTVTHSFGANGKVLTKTYVSGSLVKTEKSDYSFTGDKLTLDGIEEYDVEKDSLNYILYQQNQPVVELIRID